MKKVFTFLATIVVATTIFAQQPPNNGFESWPANNRNPTNWSTIESAANDAGLGFAIASYKFSSKETAAGEYSEGSSAVSIQSDSVDLSAFGQGKRVIPGVLFLSKIILSLTGSFDFSGVAFTAKPDLVKFAYKYKPVGGDTASFLVGLTKYNALLDTSEGIGGAFENIFETTGNNWDTITAPIDYDPLKAGQSPDTLVIGFFASGSSGHENSKLWVDNVRFVYNNPNGVVEVPVETPTVAVYPNPANSVVNFRTDADLNNAIATIYSLEGKLVVNKTISNNLAEVNELAAGRYFFTIHRDGKAIGVGNFSLVK